MSALMVNFTPGDRTPGNAPFLLDDMDDFGLSTLSDMPKNRGFEFGKNLLSGGTLFLHQEMRGINLTLQILRKVEHLTILFQSPIT